MANVLLAIRVLSPINSCIKRKLKTVYGQRGDRTQDLRVISTTL